MPNVGRPSRDCHLCRQRRVKCDLAQPECNRCVRLGRSCPGYRDELDLMFHVENPTSFAQGVNRDRRRKRLSPPYHTASRRSSSQRSEREGSGNWSEQDGQLDSGDSTNPYHRSWKLTQADVVVFSGWYLSPTRQLAECWDNHAFTLAFSNIMCPQRHNAALGLLDTNFLTYMVSEAGQDAPIVLACRAIGHAFLTSKVDTPETRSKRAATYGHALEATNLALEDPIAQTQDETLASVWLLSLYELIVSPGKWRQPLDFSPNTYGIGSWIVHTQGLVSLLRLRGTSHFKTPIARDLFWLIYNSVQVRCFITNISSPAESPIWFRELEKDLSEDELPTYQLCLYGHHASTLCATIRQIMNQWTDSAPSAAAEIVTKAQTFQAKMQHLWHVTPDSPSSEATTISDMSIRQLCCRTYLHAFRLKLELTLLQLLRKMRTEGCDANTGTLEDEFQLRVENIQSVADEILACVPLILSAKTAGSQRLTPRLWRDGVRLLWPLRLVALWDATRDDQKRAARITLQQIRDDVGINPAGAFPQSFFQDFSAKPDSSLVA